MTQDSSKKPTNSEHHFLISLHVSQFVH